MKSLKEFIQEAENNRKAIGHFNVSDLAGLKAVFAAAKELSAQGGPASGGQLPIIIGVSEGERDFIGVKQVAALIKSLRAAPVGGEPRPNGREEYNYPIFLNADHTHSLEKVKEAIEAGFDALVFDVSQLPLEENIKKTKEVVEYVKSVNLNILVEGEMGYIGSGSTILREIPEGAAVRPEDLTKPEEATRFIKETGVDLFAPAVGNIHGILKDASQPNLNIERIREIKNAVGIPLVLHGGSGIKNEELAAAIDAGISIIHINTELRLAWRHGMEKSFKEKPDEIVPYKLLPTAVEEIKKIVEQKLKLFNKLTPSH